jgi:uncharacterized phage protein (TIGR02218 family)
MRFIPPALQAHLDTGTTTLCTCWLLTRRDGVKLGFTDHDRDVRFDDTLFEAATGFTATEVRETVGNAVDNFEVEGALTSDRLRADDLDSGLYDNARVDIWRVNWQDVSQRLRLRTGSLGEIGHSRSSFTAEVRGLSHFLQQEQGRTYQYPCDADVGDRRCTVNLQAPAFKGSGTVLAVPLPQRLVVSGLSAFASDWFSRGLLTWNSGPDAGRTVMVQAHRVEGSTVTLDLWQRSVKPLTTGRTFTVTAGCDKQHATCRAKFSNGLNFRGFPHMPGSDFVTSYPNRDEGSHDGQSPRA